MRQLVNLLYNIQQNIPYYKNMLANTNLSLNNALSVLLEMPIVNKNLIKQDYSFFIDPNYYNQFQIILHDEKHLEKEINVLNGEIVSESTSGSTGCPFTSIKSSHERILLGKYLWDLRRSVHSTSFDKFINLISGHRNGGYPFPFKHTTLSRERSERELRYLSERDYEFWHILPDHLRRYSNILEDTRLDFRNLKVIETNGSHISKNEIAKFRRLFDCTVVDNYGCREVWNIAYGCQNGNLHINDKTIIFELIDDSGNVITEPNIYGNVVVTSLVQMVMPFVRYKIGDRACYVEGQCSCGRLSKMIKIFPGRKMILNSSLNGTELFRTVIHIMVKRYHMSNFGDVNIIENPSGVFSVNIKDNSENPPELEQAFIETASSILPVANRPYTFKFSYNNETHEKEFYLSLAEASTGAVNPHS